MYVRKVKKKTTAVLHTVPPSRSYITEPCPTNSSLVSKEVHRIACAILELNKPIRAPELHTPITFGSMVDAARQLPKPLMRYMVIH
mmetsp:Transcript_13400/g.31546  ORF Transcript_13400/g.31546 Transcript_13400/m.31546 type:complete len:86 (-) Transcript_13400:1544-1801(-)